MINPSSMSERLLFSTIRIETEGEDGVGGTGTGFFFSFPVDGTGTTIPAIVTNNHVVAGSTRGTFLIHGGQDGKPTDQSHLITLDQFESRWTPHPDPSIDLCAMPCGFLTDKGELFHVGLDESLIPTPEQLGRLTAIEPVMMVGYPNGLWDEANNLPLFRRGVTASHPAIDFDGTPRTVIDLACFPGSSGSPVLIVDESAHWNKFGHLVDANGRVLFLGVLSQGPVMQQDGEIVLEPIPTAVRAKARTDLMIHLGYIIKSSELGPLGKRMLAGVRAGVGEG